MNNRIVLTSATAAMMALAWVGCTQSNAGTQDQAITQAVQAKLNADPALQGAGITAATENGVVTLSGSVSTDAARSKAAADAQVPGATQVNNQIATNSPANPAAGHAMKASNAMTAGSAMKMKPAAPHDNHRVVAEPTLKAVKPVEVETGTDLHVRLNKALSSSTATAGQEWEGTISSPVRVNGEIAIPQGASVSGTVVDADSAGHFKGQSRLVLKATRLSYNGASYDLTSHDVTKLAASRTKRTAATVGGGAAVGALIGALAGHGKGAAIGAAVGAGAGTAAQAATKPAEVELTAETPLSFTLSAPLQVVPAATAGN